MTVTVRPVSPPLHVDSEVGHLKQVMVHEPGLELDRLTPQNCDSLLFDDVMWARKAREEHRAFADGLRERGITVHLFRDKLARRWRSRRPVRSCSTGSPAPRPSGHSWSRRCASSLRASAVREAWRRT